MWKDSLLKTSFCLSKKKVTFYEQPKNIAGTKNLRDRKKGYSMADERGSVDKALAVEK